MLIPSYSAFLRFSDFAWRATPFEALGGVQVGDIAVCWSILISLSVKAYMLWLFFEGIVLGEVKVTGF